MTDQTSLPEKLNKIREQRLWTWAQLARAAGVSVGTVWGICNGKEYSKLIGWKITRNLGLGDAA